LAKTNKPELQAIYTKLLGEAPDESLTRQQLIDAIVAAQPSVDESAPASAESVEAPAEIGTHFYGNKDKDKKHLLPADWVKKVCVYQCQIDQMNGGVVEIPNTHQLQTYDPALYEKLSKDEKGKPSFFSESKMKVDVLHDPR
jgi:hypothetical protein